MKPRNPPATEAARAAVAAAVRAREGPSTDDSCRPDELPPALRALWGRAGMGSRNDDRRGFSPEHPASVSGLGLAPCSMTEMCSFFRTTPRPRPHAPPLVASRTVHGPAA